MLLIEEFPSWPGTVMHRLSYIFVNVTCFLFIPNSIRWHMTVLCKTILVLARLTTYPNYSRVVSVKKIEVPIKLNKHYDIRTYGRVNVKIHGFLTSAIVEGEWSASLPGRFTLQYPLDRKLGGSQTLITWRGEKSCPLGIQTPTPWPFSTQPDNMPNALSRLSLSGKWDSI
jgi:hypothetical protein